ncbi:hypothetical protein [Fimbriiglobus ruber]|uniref:Uncharacterized protein n=1 Tax=Fimbriiglobus ruber TaxID=1908690 RepID=A0A225DH96_9BACT|nr:hypothetical protein [Fimbriiglobus ruber]OWK37928.1 hypothetical protein FRUB_07048 [Fimbriiglobus ruber]
MMLKPFFAAAMLAPGRQLSFRRLAASHVLMVAGLTYAATAATSSAALTTVGYLFLVLGLVEGAALVGWRLTQLPKSQALEFLLTSPVHPRGVFAAEALVGVARFALVWLAGAPVAAGLIFTGTIDPADLIPILVMPFVWGTTAGLALTAWVYEPRAVRRIGELCSLAAVLVYLVVGVVAGENLRAWLEQLPEVLGRFLFEGVIFLHTMNPFGVVRYWFASDRVDWLAWERFEYLHLFAAALMGAAGLRAAFRLKGHYHDRHYRPLDSSRAAQLEQIGNRPLSWWAVRRVMEYSGRVNLWIAGGVAILYAAFIVAGDDWPAWMGRVVFVMFEGWGGAPMVATALAVLAAVPAAYQFGLWDPTVPDRCRRLELLLLTELRGIDYWHASLAAAWRRGRGYLFSSMMLWLALGISGRNPWWDVAAAVSSGVLLWAFTFAVGFRAFATGGQSNGLASLLTLGLPILVVALFRGGWDQAANFVPTALCYTPLAGGVTWAWAAGFTLIAGATTFLTRRGLARCDADLRRWYDQNQGSRSVE